MNGTLIKSEVLKIRNDLISNMEFIGDFGRYLVSFFEGLLKLTPLKLVAFDP